MTRTRLDSASEAIEVLGGTKAVMALTGAKSPTVLSWWRRNNRFPSKYSDLVKGALETAGYTATREMLGQKSELQAAE
jgi:hypothetical protein